jgi:hypothetical protein
MLQDPQLPPLQQLLHQGQLCLQGEHLALHVGGLLQQQLLLLTRLTHVWCWCHLGLWKPLLPQSLLHLGPLELLHLDHPSEVAESGQQPWLVASFLALLCAGE